MTRYVFEKGRRVLVDSKPYHNVHSIEITFDTVNLRPKYNLVQPPVNGVSQKTCALLDENDNVIAICTNYNVFQVLK